MGSVLNTVGEANSYFVTLQEIAKSRIEAFDNGDHSAATIGQSPQQPGALERGVRYRVIYDSRMLQERKYLEAAISAVKQGESARVSNLIPARMLIRDREEALFIARGFPDVEVYGFHTRNPVLVDHAVTLFEAIWDHAVEFNEVPTKGVADLTENEVALLNYLNLGLTDDAIARSMQVSVRTVQRRVQALQNRFGVKGRFQLGYVVAKSAAFPPSA